MLRQIPSSRRVGALAAAAVAGAITTVSGTPAGAVVGDQAADGAYAYTVKLTVGDSVRACTGALVDPRWVITAASCFSDDPAQPATLRPGAPKRHTSAAVGRADAAPGQVRDVVELVPRQDRDLVMARLAEPVRGVPVLPVATTAPTAGQTLRVAGFGRTKDEWAPARAHTGTLTVDAVQAAGLDTSGVSGAAVCKGDTGAPVIRELNGRAELAAVASRSWQGGCLGSAETRTGAYDVRTDDVAPWIEEVRSHQPKADVAALYNSGQADDGTNVTSLFRFANTGSGYFKAPEKAWASDNPPVTSWDWNRSKVLTGDFGGTGRKDLVVLYDSGQNPAGKNLVTLYEFTNNGNGYDAPVKVWDNDNATTGSWDWNRSKPVVGDLDGDGKADIAVMYNSGQGANGKNLLTVYKFAGNGRGFDAPAKVWDNDNPAGDSWDWNRIQPAAGDFGGTGRADIAVLYNNGQSGTGKNITTLYKFPNNGTGGLTAPVKLWDNDDSTTGSWDWNRSKFLVGDFGGTGKAEAVVLYNNGQNGSGKNITTLYKFANNGSGAVTTPAKVWDNDNATTGSWDWNRSKPVVADVDGDGKDDVAVMYNSGQDGGKNLLTVYRFTSDGKGFTAPVNVWDNNDRVNGSWNWDRSTFG
ncbi:trypsin-like serine protease [Streptomyces sp. SP17BM10]|uniref:trypsin-like serine protease n=1 Tax=Streptomyces sp. SP17BM10 TaxID=3002530 RepID=UPI002E79DFAE|nr:trypsin-like serine protease [Streptomyces sp. SP17BM10]MEE1783223.1 trypsin-like serine protease [Streptomyces sp. SP17BM10]